MSMMSARLHMCEYALENMFTCSSTWLTQNVLLPPPTLHPHFHPGKRYSVAASPPPLPESHSSNVLGLHLKVREDG
jgi:hypothetical protein